MAKYKELVYMCLDEIKLTSDDSFYTEDHVIFLLDKYRVMLLKKMYTDIKKDIPESNYLTICLNLELFTSTNEDICGRGTYLRSIEKVPFIIPIGSTRVYTSDYFGKDIQYVTRDRMRYVGNNKWLNNILYASIAPDEHLWIKGSNNSYLYLEKVLVTGVFEDAKLASLLSCNDETTFDECNIMEQRFPIEESLITTLIQSVVVELLGAAYRPKDDVNNASDDLAALATFIRLNVKTPLAKAIEGDNGNSTAQ